MSSPIITRPEAVGSSVVGLFADAFGTTLFIDHLGLVPLLRIISLIRLA